MQVLSILSTSVWFIISLVFRDFFVGALSIGNPYINLMFLYLMFFPTITLFQNMERFKYMYKWTVAISLMVSVGSSLLSVILVLYMPNRLLGRVMGHIIPVVILGSIILIFYCIRVHKIELYYWKYALPFALPFIPHLLSMLLLGGMDRVMIRKICGAEDLALYSLAYSVGSLITILVNSVNSAYSPWLGEQLAKKNYTAVNKFSTKYVALFVYAAIGAILVTPEILLILGGQTYMDAIYVMPPVAAGCIMQFVYCMYVNVEQFEKKTIGMAIASITAAGINGILNAILIPVLGYVAAAYTTFIGYLCLMLMHMALVYRIKMSSVYQNKRILIISILASALIFCSNVILKTRLIRYTILVIYLMIALTLLVRYRAVLREYLKR